MNFDENIQVLLEQIWNIYISAPSFKKNIWPQIALVSFYLIQVQVYFNLLCYCLATKPFLNGKFKSKRYASMFHAQTFWNINV